MKPGIYEMDAPTYHKDPCERPSLSSSIAGVLCNSSPMHAFARHPRLTEAPVEDESDAMSIGTVAHALMLQGEHVAEVLPFKDWRTDASKDARKAAWADGKIPILAKHWPDIQAMVNAANEQLGAFKDEVFETPGLPERVIIWQESNGVWCRSRLDWLPTSHRTITDYKTTGATANPEVISRTLFSNCWDIQAAFYARGLKTIDPFADPVFRFCVQETHKPYALSVVALGPDSLMLGEKKVAFAIEKFGECLESGVWPGYPTETCYATLPTWEEQKWLDRETKELV